MPVMFTCPCCEREGRMVDLYDEEDRMIEHSATCKCGFSYVWSYGREYYEWPEGYNEDGEKEESE